MSVVSDSVQPHRQEPTRLLCPWDSPGWQCVLVEYILHTWSIRLCVNWYLISSSQQLYEIGTWISPFYRWRNWLREITWSSARSWKEQNWQVNRDLTGLKARGLRPSSCTASSNYAAFSRPLKGCKEGMARTTVQFAFDTSLEFLVWFFKKRRKVFE